MEVTIKLKKKVLLINLIFGSIWLISGIVDVFFIRKNLWYGYISILLGLAQVGVYLFDVTHQYLIIKNGAIKEITHIKKITKTYIIYTEQTKLTINLDLIEKESLIKLKQVFSKLNLL